MNKKTIFNSVQKTILFFAVTHIIVLMYLAITTQNLTYLNIFSVLDLQEFFPGIEIGTASTIASIVFVLIVYFVFQTGRKR